MKRVRAVVLPLILVVVTAGVCFPQATTYWVDFEGGSDALAGTSPFAAFRHCPGDPMAEGNAARTTLKPGDVVVFKSGVTYRGRIVVQWSGAPNQPITFMSEQPGAPAIIDGSEPLTGWQRCASAEECGGNPNWRNIYFAPAPAGTGPFNANLFLDETMHWIAQDPNLQDPLSMPTDTTNTVRPHPRM